MTEPYDWPDPTPPARAPRVLVYVALFAIGFAGVLGVLFLRAPRPLGFAAPPGYVRLTDAESGSGAMSATRAARFLGLPAVAGYERSELRAYGRPAGEPPRAVLLLVVETNDAATAYDAAVAAMRARGGTPFGTPPGFTGFHDVQDSQGRHVQRVVWSSGDRLTVVSLLTPQREADVAEVLEIARRQEAY